MKVEQIYTGCLAHGAYYIVSEGEAAIIDPLREIQPYVDRAHRDGVKIKYIFETHFHADFVSGHLDLARVTGAPVVYGPTAVPGFEAYVGKDGEEFRIGKVTVRLLHTPGHTMESSCFLLQDEAGRDYAVFTGDTLFIGDVGRPDLAQKAAKMTSEQLAATLYHSLRDKIMPLADDVLVYPGHGAGSACGKNLSKETVSTIGAQKQFNYALRANMTEQEFVEEVLEGLTPPPAYFPLNATMNKMGYESIDTVLERGLRRMSVKEFEAAATESGAAMIDTRDAVLFGEGLIPNSINIGLDGQFAPWVGALVPDVRHPILLITEPGKEAEAVTRLARVGYDYVIGYLDGGFPAWKAAGKEVDNVRTISAEDFVKQVANAHPVVIDVRRNGEFADGHLEGALNLPLDYINDHLASFPKDKTFYIHCAGGYRSMTAASILKLRGWDNFFNIGGGFNAMKKEGINVVTTAGKAV